VTYALYENEEHWPGTWSYPNQVDVVNRTIEWFERYLKDE
jgi:dipeptidyl aminopeptidase/acylaminoacyl peptidase